LKRLDLTGERFGRLTAVSIDHITDGRVFWLCRCECGEESVIRLGHLRSGHTLSCGCLALRLVVSRSFVHGRARRGKARSREYISWALMIQRCTNPKRAEWKYYGGRGVAVCERWKSFENFLADMGARPGRKSLDRIDNDGNYESGNCRWATRKEQRANRRDSRRAA
jgi:hypothetical protein